MPDKSTLSSKAGLQMWQGRLGGRRSENKKLKLALQGGCHPKALHGFQQSSISKSVRPPNVRTSRAIAPFLPHLRDPLIPFMEWGPEWTVQEMEHEDLLCVRSWCRWKVRGKSTRADIWTTHQGQVRNPAWWQHQREILTMAE